MTVTKEALTPLDFVQMYLFQTEGHPQNGHYVNAVACRRKWPNKDDTRNRCSRCDGEALLEARFVGVEGRRAHRLLHDAERRASRVTNREGLVEAYVFPLEVWRRLRSALTRPDS
jgi:hypothetical protein